jgi:hypothetical protein
MVKERGGSALTEQNVGGENLKRADVLLRIGGQQRWIDVEFRSPAGSACLTAGSFKKDGVANKHTEERKNDVWSKVASKDVLKDSLVIAAIEDGGRMGDQLLGLLDEVGGMDKIRGDANSRLAAARRDIVQELQTIRARYNARMVNTFRSNLVRPAGMEGVVLRDLTLRRDFVGEGQDQSEEQGLRPTRQWTSYPATRKWNGF